MCIRDSVIEVDSSSVSINRGGETELLGNNVSGYVRENRIFIDAVKSGTASEIRAPYSEGLRTLQLSLAASKSFLRGKQIDL